MRVLRIMVYLGSALWFGPTDVQANVLPIGVLSYDVLIPGSLGNPGVNAFTVSNLTGDPGLGGAALLPDFNVFTFLTFLSPTLIVAGDVNGTITLPDIGLGSFSSGDVQFPDITTFSSAVLNATLSSTTLLLANGDIFTVNSAFLTATLLPSRGPFLLAGTDLVVLQVSGTEAPSTVPEPASLVLLGSVVGTVLLACRRHLG